MTPLRQRMIEDMQLRGLSRRTQEAYVAAVRQLAEHYGKWPDLLRARTHNASWRNYGFGDKSIRCRRSSSQSRSPSQRSWRYLTRSSWRFCPNTILFGIRNRESAKILPAQTY
jgi:hypothetical protein